LPEVALEEFKNSCSSEVRLTENFESVVIYLNMSQF